MTRCPECRSTRVTRRDGHPPFACERCGVGFVPARPIIFSTPMIRALLDGRKTQTRRILRPQPACYQNPPGFSWGRFSGLYPDDWFGYGNEIDAALPYSGGDRLWVREAWQAGPPALPSGAGIMLPSTPMPGHKVIYRADGDDYIPKVPWRSPIYMPRLASRLTLTLTDVRVQRLQEISEEDAKAEGVVWQDPTEEDLEWERICAREDGRDPEISGVWIAPGTRQGFGPTKEARDRPKWGPTAAVAYSWIWEQIHGPRSWGVNPWVVALTFTVERRNVDEDAA